MVFNYMHSYRSVSISFLVTIYMQENVHAGVNLLKIWSLRRKFNNLAMSAIPSLPGKPLQFSPLRMPLMPKHNFEALESYSSPAEGCGADCGHYSPKFVTQIHRFR